MGFSSQTATDILNYFFRTRTVTQPATLYVSLHLDDPLLTGASEVPLGVAGYARVGVAANTTNWSAPAPLGADYEIHNLNPIGFAATGSWGNVRFVGIWRDPTSTLAANFMFGGATSNKIMNNGDTYTFPATTGLTLKVR